MKASDFEKAITFTEEKRGNHYVVHGDLIVQSTMFIDAECFVPGLQHAKQHIIENIMRQIYEDQSDEMHRAIYEFLKCDHFDYDAIGKAGNKLIELAKRQQPRFEKESQKP